MALVKDRGWYKRNTPGTLSGGLLFRSFPIARELEPIVFGWLADLLVDWVWDDTSGVPFADVEQQVQAMLKGYGPMMIGSMLPFAGTLPPNVLPCDGQQYDRIDYPELYSVLEAVYIVDADRFVVPDRRGRMSIGAGSGSGLTPRVAGDIGGEENHVLTLQEIPQHSHSVHTHGISINVEEPIPGAPYPISTPDLVPGQTGNTGSGDSHNNMPPYGVDVWGIIAW